MFCEIRPWIVNHVLVCTTTLQQSAQPRSHSPFLGSNSVHRQTAGREESVNAKGTRGDSDCGGGDWILNGDGGERRGGDPSHNVIM